MFLTDDDVRRALAATLKQSDTGSQGLAAYWDEIIPKAHSRAFRDIVSRLLRRGFTLAQVEAWDGGEEFERDQSLYWCLRRGGMYAGYDRESVEALDRRGELKSVLLEIDGEWVKPTGDKPGLITTAGPLANDRNSIFSWPDPDDENLGKVTRW